MNTKVNNAENPLDNDFIIAMTLNLQLIKSNINFELIRYSNN